MSPLISCIMPTRDRRRYVADAVRAFEAQVYPNKELIVVDNGTEPIADLVPVDAQYRYVGQERISTGLMRNHACEMARGTIIAHWDDDDYSHPQRLHEQQRLMMGMSVSLVGYNEMFFLDEDRKKAWLYRNPELYALGTSLMYTRHYWRAGVFPDKLVAEDTDFIARAQWRRAMSVTAAYDRLIARIHAKNTCDKNPHMIPPMWTEYHYDIVRAMVPHG